MAWGEAKLVPLSRDRNRLPGCDEDRATINAIWISNLVVVRRLRMIEDGKLMEVNVHVDDPGAFTTAWNAIQRYRRVDRAPMGENVCAENNDDHFHHDLEPMPQADKPDF
jgi:hypothetical protein